MLYQLSYGTTHWERSQFIEFIFSRAVEALIFFRLLLSNCLNWKIYCDDHSSLHLQPQYKYELFHIYLTSLHCTAKYELNKLTSLPMCGTIAQLVEHRTGIAEVTGSNPVEALIFFRLLLSNCLNWKIYCDDHSSLLLKSECYERAFKHKETSAEKPKSLTFSTLVDFDEKQIIANFVWLNIDLFSIKR